MPTSLAPLPEHLNFTLPTEGLEALAREERYSRKGAINPPVMVTRQQFIEDILACGFVELKRSHNSRTGHVVAVSVSRGEGPAKQFYTLNRKWEIEYLLKRHEQVMAARGEAQNAEGRKRVDENGHGWKYGEQVSQQLSVGGESFEIKGVVIVNSAQRWRVKIVDTGGAPYVRVGMTHPVTAAWQRKTETPAMEIPVIVPAQAPSVTVEPAVTQSPIPSEARWQEGWKNPDGSSPTIPAPSDVFDGAPVAFLTDGADVGMAKAVIVEQNTPAGPAIAAFAAGPVEGEPRDPAPVINPQAAPGAAPQLFEDVLSAKKAVEQHVDVVDARARFTRELERSGVAYLDGVRYAVAPHVGKPVGFVSPDDPQGWTVEVIRDHRRTFAPEAGTMEQARARLLAMAFPGVTPEQPVVAAEQSGPLPEVGAEVFSIPETGGKIVGRVFRVASVGSATEPGELRVRVIRTEGPAGQRLPRGATVPWSGEWHAIIPDAVVAPASAVQVAQQAPTVAQTEDVGHVYQFSTPEVGSISSYLELRNDFFRSHLGTNPEIADAVRRGDTRSLGELTSREIPRAFSQLQAAMSRWIRNPDLDQAVERLSGEVATASGAMAQEFAMAFAAPAPAPVVVKLEPEKAPAPVPVATPVSGPAPITAEAVEDPVVWTDDLESGLDLKAIPEVAPVRKAAVPVAPVAPAPEPVNMTREQIMVDRFAQSLPALQRPRAVEALNSRVRLSDGRVVTRAQHIIGLVDAGAYIETAKVKDPARAEILTRELTRLQRTAPIGNERHPDTIRYNEVRALLADGGPWVDERRLYDAGPERIFRDEAATTKTAMNFAVFAISQKEQDRAIVPEQTKPEVSASVPEQTELFAPVPAEAAPVEAPHAIWVPERAMMVHLYELGEDNQTRWIPVRGELVEHPALPGMLFAMIPDAHRDPSKSDWLAVIDVASGTKLAWGPPNYEGSAGVPALERFEQYVLQTGVDRTRGYSEELVRKQGAAPQVLPVPVAQSPAAPVVASVPVEDLVAAPEAVAQPVVAPVAAVPQEAPKEVWEMNIGTFRRAVRDRRASFSLTRSVAENPVFARNVKSDDLLSEIERYSAITAYSSGATGVAPQELTPEQIEAMRTLRVQLFADSMEYYVRTIQDAIAAGKPVPVAIQTDVKLFRGEFASLGYTPAQNLNAEAAAQALSRSSEKHNPFKPDAMSLPEYEAFKATQLQSFRTMFTQHVSAIENRDIGKILPWINSSNPESIRLLIRLTNWQDPKLTETNARAALAAWVGADKLEAFERDEALKREADREAKSVERAKQVLASTRRAWFAKGSSSERIELSGDKLIEQLVEEGYRTLRKSSGKGALGGWIFSHEDGSRPVILRSSEERVYATFCVKQASATAAAPSVAAEQAVTQQAGEQASVPVSTAFTRAKDEIARVAAATAGNAIEQAPEAPAQTREDALKAAQKQAVEKSVEDAIAAGAWSGKDREIKPLEMVSWHTASGPVNLVVARMEGESIVGFHTAEYLAGESIVSVKVPRAEVTSGTRQPNGTVTFPALDRSAGAFREKIALIAGDAVKAMPPEDEVAGRLSALAVAASKDQDAEVAAILAEPAVALAIGETSAVYVLEAQRAMVEATRELRPEERNFYFGRDEQVAPRSIASRTKANIKAVQLLKKLKEEDRMATPEEKKVLAGFSGWGSMKGIFDDLKADQWKALVETHARTNGTFIVQEWNQASYRYINKPHQFLDLKEFMEAAIEKSDGLSLAREGSTDSTGRHYLSREALKELDSWHDRWGRIREDLEAALTPEEMEYASASSINAHYTDEVVCHRMWDIAKSVGFAGGVVLEPAVGSGRVVSAMPSDLRDKCSVIAVEKDKFSASLAAALLPEAKVWADPFEHSPVKPGTADLVITNVPFADIEVNNSGFNLHNFFIAHSMEKLKPGGLAVLITTSNSLDKNLEQRVKLSTMAELCEAVRLPNDAFAQTAGTDVTTDILVLRKPSMALGKTGELFRATMPVEVSEAERPDLNRAELDLNRQAELKASREGKTYEPVVVPAKFAEVNEYYTRHPERALGVPSLRGSMYGNQGAVGQYALISPTGAAPLADRLDAAIATMRPVKNSSSPVIHQTEAERTEAQLTALKEDAIGKVVSRDGKMYRVAEYRELVPLKSNPTFKLTKAQEELALEQAEAFVRLREAFTEQIITDLSAVTTPERSAEQRKVLRSIYDEYVEAFGPLNGKKSLETLKAVCYSDPHLHSVLALEDVSFERKDAKRVKVCKPARILSERTMFPSTAPDKAETLDDAVSISLAERMRIDVGYIARLLGKDPVEGEASVRDELLSAGIAFRDPLSSELVHRNHYLSGDVMGKLEKARQISLVDPDFITNVRALESAQPREIPFEEMKFSLGDAWLPHEVLTAYYRGLGLSAENDTYTPGSIVYDEAAGWMPKGATGSERSGGWDCFFRGNGRSQGKTLFGIQGVDYSDILRGAMCGKVKPVLNPKTEKLDPVLTRAVEDKVGELVKHFQTWLQQPAQADMRDKIATSYNRSFNRIIQPTWDGSRLRLPNLSTYQPMKHQRDAVQRILTQQRGVIAHGVGFGKTLEIIMAAYEAKRMGIVNKPLIVCDSANYEQFVADAHRCYPAARILHCDEGGMSPSNRENFKGLVASGDYDLILVSREQFGLMKLSPERVAAAAKTEAALAAKALESEDASPLARTQAKRKAKELQKLLDKVEAERKAGVGLTFEQMGIDLLLVDEAHRHKKIGFETRFEVKGIDTGRSARGFDLLLKAQYLQEIHGNGRGAIGFTGTPVSNTAAELHTAARIFDPTALENFSVPHFDRFMTAFGRTVTELELNEANGRWRYVERLSRYKNFREFQRFLHSFADIRLDPTELGIKRPGHEKGGFELGNVPLSMLVWEGQQIIGDIYKAWEDDKVEAAKSGDKEAMHEAMQMAWVQLALMGLNSALAIDPRLVDPKAKVGKDAMVYGIADEIARVYHEKNASKVSGKLTHTQVVFCDRIQSGLDRMFPMDLSNGYSSSMGEMLYAEAKEKFLARMAAKDGGLDMDDSPDSSEDEDEEETMTSGALKRRGLEEVESMDKAGNIVVNFKNATKQDNGRFNLWEELRHALIERGVPAEQIATVADAKNKKAKLELYERMNAGELACLIGSSDRMGVGANFQKRLYMAHHVDPCRSMTPDGMEQRNGRILRQGNTHGAVRVTSWGMSDTVIPAIYGRINYKQAMANQVYAKPGNELEFEESKDMGAEAMRASLLTDTRARDCAMLMTEIRELNLQKDADAQKVDTLKKQAASAAMDVNWRKARIGDYCAVAQWFADNTVAPSNAPKWDVHIKFPLGTVTPWDEALVKKAGLTFLDGKKEAVSITGGEPDATAKLLGKFFDAWREDETARPLASVTINGMQFRLNHAKITTRQGSMYWGIDVRFADPVKPFDESKVMRTYHQFDCRSVDAFISQIDTMVRDAAWVYSSEKKALDRAEAESVKTEAAFREVLAKMDFSEVNNKIVSLNRKISELQQDMQERPFAGRLPKPASNGKCEVSFSVPSVEAKLAMEAKKQQQPAPMTANAVGASIDVEALVDYILNVRDNDETPKQTLAEMAGCSEDVAERWINAFDALGRTDPDRFRKAQGAEMGDRTLRGWIDEQKGMMREVMGLPTEAPHHSQAEAEPNARKARR